MKKLLIPSCLVCLFVFVGCGDESDTAAEGDSGEQQESEGVATREALVESFIEAANNNDRQTLYSLFINEQVAEQVWRRIVDHGLRFSEDYSIEPGQANDVALFDDARWVDEEAGAVYEQELYISNWNAEGDEIEGWLFNGQGRRFVSEAPGDETVE